MKNCSWNKLLGQTPRGQKQCEHWDVFCILTLIRFWELMAVGIILGIRSWRTSDLSYLCAMSELRKRMIRDMHFQLPQKLYD